jgi:hypothetical protein
VVGNIVAGTSVVRQVPPTSPQILVPSRRSIKPDRKMNALISRRRFCQSVSPPEGKLPSVEERNA